MIHWHLTYGREFHRLHLSGLSEMARILGHVTELAPGFDVALRGGAIREPCLLPLANIHSSCVFTSYYFSTIVIMIRLAVPSSCRPSRDTGKSMKVWVPFLIHGLYKAIGHDGD